MKQLSLLDKELSKDICCLGQDYRYTNKNYVKGLYGRRYSTEIFSIEDILVMYKKLVPLIKNIFFNHSSIYGGIGQPRGEQKELYKKRATSVRILFATTTIAYGTIIQKAAIECNMPYVKDRWLCGALSGAVRDPNNKKGGDFQTTDTMENLQLNYVKNLIGTRIQNPEVEKQEKEIQTPDLLVIPDIKNNIMIGREAMRLKIPIVSLINSNCKLDIDYGIPGNDASPHCVQLFCELVSGLIKKETSFFEHNRSIISTNIIEPQRTELLKKTKKSTRTLKKEIKASRITEGQTAVYSNINNKTKVKQLVDSAKRKKKYDAERAKYLVTPKGKRGLRRKNGFKTQDIGKQK